MKLIQSYVFHKEKCFFVSTINRESSAAQSGPPMIYAETMVWTSNTRKFSQDNLIYQDSDLRDCIDVHTAICKRLVKTGQCEIEESDDE